MTGAQLHEWRLAHGYTQAQLAQRLGVEPISVSRWETGERGIQAYLPLALKGLLFSHGVLCGCQQCRQRYPREASLRDPR